MESPKLVGLLREGKHGEFMCDSRCTDHWYVYMCVYSISQDNRLYALPVSRSRHCVLSSFVCAVGNSVPMNRKIVPGKMRFRELDPTNEGYTTGCESTDVRHLALASYCCHHIVTSCYCYSLQGSMWHLQQHPESIAL